MLDVDAKHLLMMSLLDQISINVVFIGSSKVSESNGFRKHSSVDRRNYVVEIHSVGDKGLCSQKVFGVNF